jgi:hypothetical protein
VFSPILEALDKKNKMLVDMMECINVTQLKIEKHHSKTQKHTTKKHMQYLKSKRLIEQEKM